MQRLRTVRPVRGALALGLALAMGVALADVAGAAVTGKKPETACYAVWEGVDLTNKRDVDCVDGTECDGDGVADGKCVLGLQACVLEDELEGCTPVALTKLKISKSVQRQKGPVTTPVGTPPDLVAASCGEAGLVTLELRSNKRGVVKPSRRVKAKMVARSAERGKLRKSVNKIRMRCLPNPEPPVCPDRNAPGLPKQLSYTVPDYGTDLDNGWTGTSHNFPVVEGAQLNFCLDGCDADTSSVCSGSGPVGPNTVNGSTFGPPLPLLAAGVPVCVLNEFSQDISATIDLQSGDLEGNVQLASGIYLTDPSEVCPRCRSASGEIGSTGTCSASAAAPGRSCTVEGRVHVENASGNKDYTLSSQCLPPGSGRAGVIDITLPITTASSQLDGASPCPGTSQTDACGAGTCTSQCTGDACVEIRDGQCIDIKGGISQVCCSSDTNRPCFPSAVAPNVIIRAGAAVQPEPAWPDPTYPKTASDSVLAATFCEATSGSTQVDLVTGLPGPGALLLNGNVEITASE